MLLRLLRYYLRTAKISLVTFSIDCFPLTFARTPLLVKWVFSGAVSLWYNFNRSFMGSA